MTSASLTDAPELEATYEITSRQSAKYLEDGHFLTQKLATAEELEVYRTGIGTAAGRYNKETKKLEDRDTYHKAFLQTANLWENDELVKKFVFAKRFAKVAAQLMGVDGVRLYHDQALYKEPGGGHTPWHQDQYYWPLDTTKTITMWMPLVDTPIEMGTLVFASGSQKKGSVAQMAISDDSERFFREHVIAENYPCAIAEMEAGDATWHSGWTLHKAPGNSTNRMREVMTIIYYADGTKVAESANEHQPADRARWLSNIEPGKIADGPLTPLLWHKDW